MSRLTVVRINTLLVQKTHTTLLTIRNKTSTNHDLVTRVFPRFRQFALQFCVIIISIFDGIKWRVELT